jgi:NitT/TauT family transport system substrate-binding protein
MGLSKRALRTRALRNWLWAAAVAAAALASGPNGANAEPLKVRAGWIIAPASIIPMMFLKPGIAKHQGKSYVLEPVKFQASTLQITALAAGELEIASLGYSSVSFAILNAGMSDLKIIADEIQDGVPGYFSVPYLVRKDSSIRRVEDLKGKILATNGIGSGVHMAMSAMLKKHGLGANDFTTIEVGFPNMTAVLAERKADLITSALPFVYDPALQAIGQTLFTQRDALGRVALSFWTAREGFIAKNRAALLDLLEDYVRVKRWYVDPDNHKEAMELAANFLKVPPERMDWVFTKRDFYHDPNALPDLDALQANVKVQKELGLVAREIDVKKHADLSLVKEAAARVK